MSKLPIISARELLKTLHKIGYDVDHQTGSHIILRNGHYPYRRLTVPNHKEIARGTTLQTSEGYCTSLTCLPRLSNASTSTGQR